MPKTKTTRQKGYLFVDADSDFQSNGLPENLNRSFQSIFWEDWEPLRLNPSLARWIIFDRCSERSSLFAIRSRELSRQNSALKQKDPERTSFRVRWHICCLNCCSRLPERPKTQRSKTRSAHAWFVRPHPPQKLSSHDFVPAIRLAIGKSKSQWSDRGACKNKRSKSLISILHGKSHV